LAERRIVVASAVRASGSSRCRDATGAQNRESDTKESRMHTERRRGFAALLPFLVAVALVAGLGSLAQPGAWYVALEKPPGTPPPVVFPIVWTTLYALMAIAAWRVWRVSGFDVALKLWALQLGLNAAWSPVFFIAHRPWLAFVVIVALWLAIAATTTAFFRRDALAGRLMLPYLAWVSYAAYLNAGIAILDAGR
jgi:translocator protein